MVKIKVRDFTFPHRAFHANLIKICLSLILSKLSVNMSTF